MRALKDAGYSDITVAHPKEHSWITKSKKKQNDRVDSLKLAKLHLVGVIPEFHLLEEKERIRRDLLIQRVKLGISAASTNEMLLSSESSVPCSNDLNASTSRIG